MRKVVRLLLILLTMVFIPSFSYAQNYKQEDIENGSYVIGTYLFNKNKTANYNGTLTTPMIMLASKSISSTNVGDMKIYYKNARGKWINAINNQTITNVPANFEITCVNLNCQSAFTSPNESFITYQNSNIGSGSYIIGAYLFDKNKTTNYNGTLTTPLIMLASKSINSNNLQDMVIYYKNARGKWINAINSQSISNIPSIFEITYIDLVKMTSDVLKDDKITILEKTYTYDGNNKSAAFTTTSGLAPSVTYYTDITCTQSATPKNVGVYYAKATTSGNEQYKPAALGCTKAVTINKRTVTITAPTVNSSSLTYNGEEQIISKNAGSCTTGGEMYYYIKNYTTSTAPTFNETDWSTSYPTAKVVDAATYNIWYYCKVADTANNTGTNINKALKISKSISKANNPIAVTANQTIKANESTSTQNKTFKAATNTEGNVTYSIKSQKKGSTTVNYFTIKTASTNKITIAANTPVGTYTVVVNATAAGNNNYNSGSKDMTLTITINKVDVPKLDDTITITAKTYTYTGGAKAAVFTTTSGLEPTVTYYSNSMCSTVATPKNVGVYYAVAETAGNDQYNPATLECAKAVTINQRTVTVTAPTVNSANLTYNGSNQTISGTAGSCTAGGTMYYYVKNYTTSSAPTFNKDIADWSTTYPTATGKNARTYYMWYYCYVSDTTNNKGTNINKAIKLTKAIAKKNPTMSLSATSSTLIYGTNKTVTITTDGDGALSCASSDENVATCAISDKTLTITPKANTADSKKATITVFQAAGTNYNAATDVTYTATVNRKTITCPTSPAAKTYTGSSQASGITCPTGSTAGGNKSATNAGDYAQTCTANAGYKFASTCSVSWTINQRTVTVTAPTMNSNYLIYNGSNQTISSAAGSCTAGGTMYYYNVSYVNSTAPSFNTTNWSTTYPTIIGKNAGTYNLWYYCKVDDTTNNTGTNINTAKKVSATINKKASSIDANIDNITMNPLEAILILSNMIEGDGDGAISCSSSNESYATCSSGSNGINITNTYVGSGSKNVNITLTKAATSNYSAVSKTYTITVKGYVDVTSVSIDKSYYALKAGETYQVNATVAPTNATDKSLTWTSSDTSVATVSNSGVVTALKAGGTTITAKSVNGKTAKITISVRDNPSSLSQMQGSYGLVAANQGAGYYTYAPSIFIDESNNNHVYIYSCSNKNSYVTRDHIYLATSERGYYALTPTSGWDSYHNCDPSVVKGNFTYNGQNYKYAMAYTGIDNDGLGSGVKNRIGIAVSNSLTSGWTRIGSTAFINTTVTDRWGVGQPSLIYVNNKLILFYTNDTGEGSGMQYRIINPNGFTIESGGDLKTTGTTWMHNADFAYKGNRLYVAFEGPEHDSNNANYNNDIISNTVQIYSAYITDYTDANAYTKLTWEKENEINSSVSGKARNSNAGLFRKSSGELFDRRVGFTSTDSGKGDGHYTYNIYKSAF